MIKNTKLKEWFLINSSNPKNNIVKIFNVEYAHLKLEDDSDLYITVAGLPFIEILKPENFWTDKEWFENNSIRLSGGTSGLYKIKTKKINGKQKDIVLKWNRMGQEIPGWRDYDELTYAEFNSPFEEFSLIMELRNAAYSSPNKIIIQKPLAIYVPATLSKLWQTGRKEYKMQYKIKSHTEVDINIHRSYAVIYEWMKGIDITIAFDKKLLEEQYLKTLTIDSNKKLKKNGFIVRDNKPNHIIVRHKNNTLIRKKNNEILYGLIDFELLEKTPENKEKTKKIKRQEYLTRQKDRFLEKKLTKFHPHLHHVNIFGVDYIYGHVESTGGALWVVGKDPYLFDYFLPERWKNTPKTKISLSREVYHTISKDEINLVWQTSRVGLQPDKDPFKEDEKKILDYGYNSPFEEVAIALYLKNKGIATTYPRAIYMTGKKSNISNKLFDNSRYNSHKKFKIHENTSILNKNRDYISIWGYWNGPDEKLAQKDNDYYKGIGTLQAYREGLISEKTYLILLKSVKQNLLKVGIEDLNLRGNHLIISIDNNDNLIIDSSGIPETRVCNFEFLKYIT